MSVHVTDGAGIGRARDAGLLGSRLRRAAGGLLLLAGLVSLAWAAEPRLADALAQRRLRDALRPDAGPRRPVVALGAARVSAAGRLRLPACSLDVVAARPEEGTSLASALEVAPVAFRPRRGGPLVVAGHRDGAFAALRDAAPGQLATLEGAGLACPLRVRETRIVRPDDGRLLGELGPDHVVLSTCHPFEHLGPAPRRWLVVLEPVECEAAGARIDVASTNASPTGVPSNDVSSTGVSPIDVSPSENAWLAAPEGG